MLVVCSGVIAVDAQAQALCDAALAGLQAFAQARGLLADVKCRAAPDAAMGRDVQISSVQALAPRSIRSGALTWPVTVERGTGRSFVYQVPLTAVFSAPAWVVTRSLPAGAYLKPGDVELQSVRWPAGLDIQPANAEAAPVGRLPVAMRAGAILPHGALLPPDALLRGDPVTITLTSDAMEIRWPAQLLTPGRVGQLAKAQVLGRNTALVGRLTDAQTLKVQGE